MVYKCIYIVYKYNIYICIYCIYKFLNCTCKLTNFCLVFDPTEKVMDIILYKLIRGSIINPYCFFLFFSVGIKNEKIIYYLRIYKKNTQIVRKFTIFNFHTETEDLYSSGYILIFRLYSQL